MRNFFIIILIVGCAVQGIAQQGRSKLTAEERLTKVTEVLENEMDLSAEKLAGVQTIFKDFFETADKEREAIRQAQMARRTELVEKRNKELKETLSESEYDEMIALIETMRQQMRIKKGNRGPR